MTSVIKHALRGAATFKGGYKPEGWRPKLKVDLRGPSPAGAQLVWTVKKPDGGDWFEATIDAPELDEDGTATVEVLTWDDDLDIDEPGTAAFTLRLVSELDGIDETLHDGSITILKGEGEHVYAADNDWFLEMAYICLDSVGDSDGPRLKVTVFMAGQVDTYQVEAHCFYEGKRGAQASDVSSGFGFASNDGTAIGTELIATFDDVRGWNNLTDQNWGEDSWHMLSTNDGAYEIKFLREKKIARVVPFTVTNGRIDVPGAVEGDRWTGPVIIADATIQGDADGSHEGSAEAFYGDAATASVWLTADDVYALCTQSSSPTEGETTVAGPELDQAGQDKAQATRDAAAQLILQFGDAIEGASAPWASDVIQYADTISFLKSSYETARDAASDVPADYMTQYNDEPTSYGDLVKRTDAILAKAAKIDAEAKGGAAADLDAEVGPFKALLANDKLAVFEDHSPPSQYLYYTTNKKVIETPEELAGADEWYFEGSTEIQGKAKADGQEVDVTVTGWRVLGWSFDKDGNTVNEWEKQGEGNNAPKSAFKPEKD